MKLSSFKKIALASAIIASVVLIFSAVTFGKQILLPAGLIDAVRTFFAGNPNLSAADYKDGTILLIKPVATGVGDGRMEAGDIAEIRDGQALYERFGDGDFLGSSEKTNFLVVYYPAKLTDKQKADLIAPDVKLRRKVGVDYTKFLNTDEILKVRSFEKLDKIPEIDLSPIIQKSPEQKSVVQIPEYLTKIENAKNTLNKFVRKIIPFAYAGTGGTKTICTSGCNYTTLNLWEAGEEGILTEPAIAQITEGFQDTTAVTIIGWTTSAANYIQIYTTGAARHSGKWDNAKYQLSVTNVSGIAIVEDYVKIDGLQIKITSSVSSANGIHPLAPSITAVNNRIEISNNIIQAVFSGAGDGSGIVDFGTNPIVYVWNNIIYNFNGATGFGIRLYGTNYIYNNTIVNSLGIQGVTAGGIIAKNNIVKGAGNTNAYTGTFNASSTNNATDGTDTMTGAGGTNYASRTFSFVSEAAGKEDYHLQATDTGAKDYGVDLSGDTNLAFSNDIDANPRPMDGAWDIGADEYGHKTIINTPLSGRFKDSSLVGYWSFDGANMGTTSATDLSSNSNTGWLLNGVKKIAGLNGQALSFDGVDDYVDVGAGPSTVNTIAFWVYPTATTNYFMNITGTAKYIWANTGTVTATGFTAAPTIYVNGQVSSTIVANQWQFITLVTTTAENASNLDIGRTQDANYMSGKIDEVRFYNRVLSLAEIAEQYRAGAARMKVNTPTTLAGPTSGLVGNWTFNGPDINWATGVAFDRSGQNNNGAITNMSTTTSPVIGKSGQALSFDGSDDVVNAGSAAILDNMPALSISMWAYSKSYGETGLGFFMDKSNVGSTGWVFFQSITSATVGFWADFTPTRLQVYAAANTLTSADFNKWIHWAVTWDGSTSSGNVHIYKNGIEVSHGTVQEGDGSRDSDAARNLTIGNESSSKTKTFDGFLDEARVYNRVLSANEIQELYKLRIRKVQFKQ